jgi:Pyruvate/2-oxoacid:ferredoxin oxidoreductase delta subunit
VLFYPCEHISENNEMLKKAKGRTKNSEWYSYCKGARILEVQVAHQQVRLMDMWKVHKVIHECRLHMINNVSNILG